MRGRGRGEGGGEESNSFRLVRISGSPLLPLGTPKYLSHHSGVPPQLPQDKSTAAWEVHVADGEGRHSTHAVEEARLSSPPPTSSRNSPSGLQTPEASPTLRLTRNRQGGGTTLSPALGPTAGWSPDPQGPSPRRLPPSPQSPRRDARPQTPETLSARNRFPRLRLPQPRAPRLRPGTPPPPPLTAPSRHPSPPAPTLPARPTQARRAPQLFPGPPGPGPRSRRDPAPGAATAGRARVSLAPARPARTSCARDPLGSRASAASPGGGAGVAGTALSWRPHSGPAPGARARPAAALRSPPPAPPPPPPGRRGSGRRRSRASPRLSSPPRARAPASGAPDRSARRPLPPGSRIFAP